MFIKSRSPEKKLIMWRLGSVLEITLKYKEKYGVVNTVAPRRLDYYHGRGEGSGPLAGVERVLS